MTTERKQLLIDMGQRYFERRQALNMTQEQAAEIADVTQQAISDAELGKSFLSPECMLRLCISYGISSDYLMTGKIADTDVVRLDKRVRDLNAEQFSHYQGITEHYLAAVSCEK